MDEENLESSERKEDKPKSSRQEEDKSTLNSVLSELPDEAAPILESLPDKERKIIARAIFEMSVRRSWEGPLPDPETLKGYNDCFEGGARAVFNLAKDQSDHRKALENIVMSRELNQSGRGQNYAFILALIIFLSATFLAYTGHEWVAGVAIGFDVIGLAAVFIVGKYGMKLDLTRKKKMEQETEDNQTQLSDNHPSIDNS